MGFLVFGFHRFFFSLGNVQERSAYRSINSSCCTLSDAKPNTRYTVLLWCFFCRFLSRSPAKETLTETGREPERKNERENEKGNQNGEPKEGTKTGNQNREPKHGTKIGNQKGNQTGSKRGNRTGIQGENLTAIQNGNRTGDQTENQNREPTGTQEGTKEGIKEGTKEETNEETRWWVSACLQRNKKGSTGLFQSHAIWKKHDIISCWHETANGFHALGSKQLGSSHWA